MKRVLYLSLMLLVCCALRAQDRDSVLARMNEIKLNPEYIYGYGVMSEVDASRSEALLDLTPRVADFAGERQFRFIHGIEQCPDDAIHYITFTKNGSYYRTIAYVGKQELLAFERECTEEYDEQGLGDAIVALKDQMVRAMTMDELEEILFHSAAAPLLKYGELEFSTDNTLIAGGYMVYYDPKTRRIVEIRTPIGTDGTRRDARSGYHCDRSIPQGSTPYWIFIEEPNITR